MTDLTPNDLSHLSDEAFEALCPQGEHAPGPEPLSPAAQFVLDAYETAYTETGLVAAIRELADQVVPPWDAPSWDYELVMGTWQESNRIRRELLAIATELENQ
jgi:hypothetical protein